MKNFSSMFISLIYLFACFANESAISEILGSKVYLRQGSVQIAKNGIFIMVEDNLVPIDHLEMDDYGVYFDVSKVKSAQQQLCPVCGKPMLFNFICVNPNCPKNNK